MPKRRLFQQLLMSTALALCLAAPAHAAAPAATLQVNRADAQRPVVRSVLREGVDNETFTAGPQETTEILLSDGSSFVLAPGAQVRIKRYVWNPATGAGELSADLISGLVRVTGGALNAKTPISLSVAGAPATLEAAIALFDIAPDKTRAILLAGQRLTLAGDAGKALVRSSYGVTLANGVVSAPSIESAAAMTGLLDRLNPGLAAGEVPLVVVDQSAPQTGQGEQSARDQRQVAQAPNRPGTGGSGGGTDGGGGTTGGGGGTTGGGGGTTGGGGGTSGGGGGTTGGGGGTTGGGGGTSGGGGGTSGGGAGTSGGGGGTSGGGGGTSGGGGGTSGGGGGSSGGGGGSSGGGGGTSGPVVLPLPDRGSGGNTLNGGLLTPVNTIGTPTSTTPEPSASVSLFRRTLSQLQAYQFNVTGASQGIGSACSNNAGACSQTQANTFVTFPTDPNNPTPATSPEAPRERGATTSRLLTAGAVSNQGPSGFPAQPVYTFLVGWDIQLNQTAPTTIGELRLLIGDAENAGSAQNTTGAANPEVFALNSISGIYGPRAPITISLGSRQDPYRTLLEGQSYANPPGPPVGPRPLTNLWPTTAGAPSFTASVDGVLQNGSVRQDPQIVLSDSDPFLDSGSVFGNAGVLAVAAGLRSYLGVFSGALNPDSTRNENFNPAQTQTELVDRLPDNFLAVQLNRVTSGANQSNPCTVANCAASYLFATGDVANRPGAEPIAFDRFILTPGLTSDYNDRVGATTPGAPAVRGFFPNATLGNGGQLALGALRESGLWVITPQASTGQTPQSIRSSFLHVDSVFAVSDARVTGSSVSATLGRMTTAAVGSEANRRQIAAGAGGGLSGAGLGVTREPGERATPFASGALQASSAGGGNPRLRTISSGGSAATGTGGAGQAIGRAGYVVIETPARGAGAGAEPGELRLATGVQSQGLANLTARDSATTTLTGFVAGLVEVGGAGSAAGAVQVLDTSRTGSNTGLSLTLNPGANRVTGALTATTSAPRSLDFGGLSNATNETSGYLDRNRFVAQNTPDGAAAPSSAIIASGLIGNLPAPLASGFADGVPNYMRWGFFLGDVRPGAAAAEREVAALAPWIVSSRNATLPTSGSATYSGAAIGNVFNPGATGANQSYTTTGTVSNVFNFATREGEFRMTFDGRFFGGLVRETNGDFAGGLARLTAADGALATSAVTAAAGVNGYFAGTPNATGAAPPGMLGQFNINDAGYLAGGVFYATRPQ